MNTSLPDKIEALFAKEIITKEEYDSLNEQEKEHFNERKSEIISSLKGAELYAFISKIGALLPKDSRDDIWEFNHDRICRAINEVMIENRRMPSISELAEKSKLSRNTVRKHLAEYKKNGQDEEREERFKIMRQTLLTVLYNKAVRGDVNALKYYFEATGMTGNSKSVNKSVIENQHNYIQINNLRLSQEEIQKLSPEKLSKIEELIKG